MIGVVEIAGTGGPKYEPDRRPPLPRDHHDMLDVPTFLYRAFDSDGQLLYIGIATSWPSRWGQHASRSPFFTAVARLDVATYPTRAAALDAERAAIIAEKPLHNVVHNRGQERPRRPRAIPASSTGPQYRWRSKRSDVEFDGPLWLYPELDCSSCIDDCWSDDGEDELQFYVDYLERHHREWLDADAVPIYWSVLPVHETAPFQNGRTLPEDFLTFFTWPTDADTGEWLDWYRLPVVYDRFPAFGDALGWKPSPLQPTAPLASIIRSRQRMYPPGQVLDRRR